MKWSILLNLKSDNGWYINYIENKLKRQITNNNLQNYIELILYKPNISFNGEFINLIDENIDISDDYIITIYNKLKNTNKDCIGYKGKIFIDNQYVTFNNVSKNDNEIFYPITKLNPIRFDKIKDLKNIIYYVNSENLQGIIKTTEYIDKELIFKEELAKNIPISIILTAYKTQDYIEECLDSIENQTYFKNNDNFEVLVGVDACQDTFNKLEEIKHKYRNLKIYMMPENKGTYITTNTLLDHVNYENVIRFDTDDIMTPNLVREVLKNKKDNDILLMGSLDIIDGKIGNKFMITEGPIFFRKHVMDDVAGGYMPWRCAADTELIHRVIDKVKISQIKKALFYRRIHKDSLTASDDTGHQSELRKSYRNQIKRKYKNDEVKIDRIVNNNNYNYNYNNYNNYGIKKLVNNTNTINNKSKYFSIVIPTMWKSDKINYMLDIYEKSKYVKEIIIIDNDPSNKIDLNNYSKIIYYTENKNIFVNPAWNKGYSLSNYNLILANDDIIIYNLDEVLISIYNSEYDIIGISSEKIKNDNIIIKNINNFPANSYGAFMYIKNYQYIPEQLKIWHGDDLLFNVNNNRGILYNNNMIIDKNKTINSDISYLRNFIGKNDIIEYKKLYNNTFNELNIIIRTSNRPLFFYRCIQSIRNNHPNAKLHITIDNYNDINYVLDTLKGLNYNYYLIDKNTVYNICKKIPIERNIFIYNYYFNIIKPFINGWIINLDDDDELNLNINFQKNINNFYLFKVNIGNRIVPSLKNFNKYPVLNDISGISVLYHISQMYDWLPQRGGDYDFIKKLYDNYNAIWIDKILSSTQLVGNLGKRNDIKDKNISVNIATYPKRKKYFIKVIESLLDIDIIDIVRVYLNEYTYIPNEFPKSDKIIYHIGNKNLKDSGKFYWANTLKEEYYFTIDDDLIYNKEYFIEHIIHIRKYNNKIFVTRHGKEMKPYPLAFNDNIKSYHCLKKLEQNVWINNGGTGVMAFDNSEYTIPIELFEFHGMADMWISYYCQKNKIAILCIKHKDDLLYLLNNNNDTLFDKRNELEDMHKIILDKIGKWEIYKYDY